jgi:hypothetical protein
MWKISVASLLWLNINFSSAFHVGVSSKGTFSSSPAATPAVPVSKTTIRLLSSVNDINDGDEDDDDEEVELGKMRVSEIKAELGLRGIGYTDCFDKDSLSERLKEARATGKANPEILENFNRQKLEDQFKEEKLEVKDEDIERATAADGNLPGGMDPDVFKKLMGNEQVMTLLQSTKMQEAMKLMMTGGPGDLEAALEKDPDLLQVVEKLDQIMRGVQ